MKLHINHKKILGDLYTPIEIYLKLRDKFSNSFLLENSSNHSRENSCSYICFEPIMSYIVDAKHTTVQTLEQTTTYPTADIDVLEQLQAFIKEIDVENITVYEQLKAGIYGYTSYDSIPLVHDIQFKPTDTTLPLMQYHFFKYVIVYDHYKNELHLVEYTTADETSQLDKIHSYLNTNSITPYPFKTIDNPTTPYTDGEFLDIIRRGKEHCFRGDVFQLVLSRKYKQGFTGDEFNVYRALRSINPSPYLFYFDYGSFKIFGSSPEAQVVVKDNKAYVNPIAGTFRKTEDKVQNELLTQKLLDDPKENAEHVMLVDLARNDLSITGNQVTVEQYKTVEQYSHVIHLVSKVSASVDMERDSLQVFADTFPAGTLSGAPKHKAMELIDKYEPENRGFYGGTIGFITLDGGINHAIFIRSALSYQNELHYQAGCGIVTKSDDLSELKEIENKLSAITQAISEAQNI
ncbi:anthranilate synthase component I family protein [Myroides marinus]|uniref:anthranilate synthase component I family protein n=1 Tax=Myroides marinus TaxID=703342 RepID=UPI002577EFC0|nr:anthranilate synthase component I family protein [Myroides marinus]MDM1347208.1 anthranilate synthase component I family protein [Myroides marinus]MDM1350490.1 anthranilate synthase component I family protein [Myroides marinus]MDM1355045.1 anthranilate synthase component I family protein [Myroides marinus]MDM1357775.1 anthranilate synthase component I family protein [Myroides marinus]MDM1365132.1 anthranilate synthase component I family protein [Myroides marinus]